MGKSEQSYSDIDDIDTESKFSKSEEQDSSSNVARILPLSKLLKQTEASVSRYLAPTDEGIQYGYKVNFEDKPLQQLLTQLSCIDAPYANLSSVEDKAGLLDSCFSDVTILAKSNPDDDSFVIPELCITEHRIRQLLNSAKIYLNNDLISEAAYKALVSKLPAAEEDEFSQELSYIAGACHAQEIDLFFSLNRNVKKSALIVDRTGRIDAKEPTILLLSSAILDLDSAELVKLNTYQKIAFIKGVYRNLFNAATSEGRDYVLMSAASFSSGNPKLYFKCLHEVAIEYPQLKIIYNPTELSESFLDKLHAVAKQKIIELQKRVHDLNIILALPKNATRLDRLNQWEAEKEFILEKEIPRLQQAMQDAEHAVSEEFNKAHDNSGISNLVKTNMNIVLLANELRNAGYNCALHNVSNPDAICGRKDIEHCLRPDKRSLDLRHGGSISTAVLGSYSLNPQAYQKIINPLFYAKEIVEAKAKALLRETIRTVDSWPVYFWKSKTIVQRNSGEPLAVTRTIKAVDDKLQAGATISAANEMFKESLSDHTFFRSTRAETFYENFSYTERTLFAQQALKAIVESFAEIGKENIRGTLFKGKYKLTDSELHHLPRTAAKIVGLYHNAEKAANGVTWLQALSETRQLLLDNYCPPKQFTWNSPWRSDVTKEKYSAALDIIQFDYWANLLAYYKSDFMTRLTSANSGDILTLVELKLENTSLKFKTKVEDEIKNIKDFFDSHSAPSKENITAKLNALDYLAFKLFEQAKRIDHGKRNGSAFYKAILLTIAKYHGFPIENLDEAIKSAVIKKVEQKMQTQFADFRIKAKKFDDERSKSSTISYRP